MNKVIARFVDKYSGERYEKGDSYTHDDEDRIAFLIKKGFLEEKSNESPKSTDEIKHVGGGWYELPNGEKVKGKEEAQKVMAKLESGD